MGTTQGEYKPERDQLIVTRHPTPPERADLGGVPLVSVGETLVACRKVLGVADLVGIVDCALHLKLSTMAELQRLARRRWPTVARSPTESRTSDWCTSSRECPWSRR